MHIPKGWGIEFGVWLMGVVSAVWIVDGFLALCISFPNVRSWRKSLSFRLRQGGAKLTFDVHRPGGVGLGSVADAGRDLGVAEPGNASDAAAGVGFLDAHALAISVAPGQPRAGAGRPAATSRAGYRGSRGRGPPPRLDCSRRVSFYAQRFGIYGVTFYTPEDDRDENGMCNNVLYLDGDTGTIIGERVPGQGTWGRRIHAGTVAAAHRPGAGHAGARADIAHGSFCCDAKRDRPADLAAQTSGANRKIRMTQSFGCHHLVGAHHAEMVKAP